MTEKIPVVHGFKFAARPAGIKKSGKPDLALIFAETPALAAGVFTTNKVVAAPVVVTAPRVRRGRCQAVLVNSGNANACTGETGLRDALRCGELAARSLGISEDLVAVSSTGVIGQPLPMDKLERHIPLLPPALEAGAVETAAQAIMTTDAFPKLSFRRVEDPDGDSPYTVLGLAKGAGMIHPNMATMLAFVLTDARIEPGFLDSALRQAVDRSFNRITVDRDTSTNDMVLILSSGLAGGPELKPGTPGGERFSEALREVLYDLARMIVRDGEGATKTVRIQVRGAASPEDAHRVAATVATSNLVKTAFFGEDANWGRIIAAVGYSGARIDSTRIEIRFDDIPVVRRGLSTGPELEAEATKVLQQPEFTVTIELNMGEGEDFYLTSDLTYDYVRINAAYRT